MVTEWAVGLRGAGMARLAGRRPWGQHRRREQHARVAARRLHRQAQADLARLAEHTNPVVGPGLIGDFHRTLVAELQTWADEAATELEQLRGQRLTARRLALRTLRAEVRALCAEIEERTTKWAAEDAAVALEKASFGAGLWHLRPDALPSRQGGGGPREMAFSARSGTLADPDPEYELGSRSGLAVILRRDLGEISFGNHDGNSSASLVCSS